ncbi:MAG TPA: hypothetical protein VLV50_01930 [Stellaceae bacterium]|nr:hypothetical protein [Stellaceae bacterium]
MLQLAREAKDPVVMNELLSMAAWMHEKAKALEGEPSSSGADETSMPDQRDKD